jgi:hypothetical protein
MYKYLFLLTSNTSLLLAAGAGAERQMTPQSAVAAAQEAIEPLLEHQAETPLLKAFWL